MGTGRKCWYLVVLAAAAFAVGCTGDDDDGGAIDLTGWWLIEISPTGQGAYEPVDIVYFHQDGSTVSVGGGGGGDTLTLDGNKLTATVYDNGPGSDYQVIDLTVTQNSFSGTMTRYTAADVLIEASDLRGTRRAAPSGTLTASSPYNVNSTIAYATAEYDMGTLDTIWIDHADATGKFELRLDGFSSMGTGTYNVPSEISPEIETDSDWDWATAGTVTIDSYTVDTAIAGSYDLTLDGGGTVTGTFDVLIEMVR